MDWPLWHRYRRDILAALPQFIYPLEGIAMTATNVTLPDGSVADAHELVCGGCGQPVSEHNCGGAAGSTGSVTYSRSTGPRKPPSAHPACPHCGGRVHFNMGGTAINAECLNRQYSLDRGLMTDPNGRLPVLTLETMGEIVDWAKTLASPPTYGKMESAAGGAGTYSGLRVKTGRKKKVVAAAPGAQIQDMAEGVTVEEGEAPKTTGKKSRKGKGPKVSKLTVDENGTASAESVSLEDAVAKATNGAAIVDQEVDGDSLTETPVEATVSDEEQARAERAERRAARKALLAGKR